MAQVLVVGGGLYVLCAAALHLAWIVTGAPVWIAAFRAVNGIFLMSYAAIGAWQSVVARRFFRRGDSLRTVWTGLVIAAVVRFAGHVITNGLAWSEPHAAHGLAQLGRVVAGPGYMALVAVALAGVVRLYRRLGLIAWLTRLDLVLVGAVALFALRFLYDLVRWRMRVASWMPADPLDAVAWTSDPLLAILLLEAIVLRRAAVQMGAGYLSLLLDALLIRRDAATLGAGHVSRCWGAFAAGIFFTSLGDAGLWAQTQGLLTWPWSSLVWYIWPLAETAFAVAPTWQVVACRLAQHHERSPLGSPIVRPVAFQR